jgi:hypothetical protein
LDKTLASNRRQKTPKKCNQKIELFPAHYWAENWEPGSTLFSPRLPLQSAARKEFWETHYRIRVNGSWVGRKAKYEIYTKEQIAKKFFA